MYHTKNNEPGNIIMIIYNIGNRQKIIKGLNMYFISPNLTIAIIVIDLYRYSYDKRLPFSM